MSPRSLRDAYNLHKLRHHHHQRLAHTHHLDRCVNARMITMTRDVAHIVLITIPVVAKARATTMASVTAILVSPV